MKHRIILLAVACLLLAACADKGKTAIEQSAYGYAQALADYNIDEAFPYASQRTQEVTLEFYRRLLTMTDPASIAANTPATITIQQVEVLSDTTAIALYHKTSPCTEMDDTLRLVREEGQWVVNDVIEVPAMFDTARHNKSRLTPEIVKKLKRAPAGAPLQKQ